MSYGYARPGYRDGRDRRVKRMRTYKKVPMHHLVERIRAYVLNLKHGRFTKEALADRFQVREHEVAHALHILNRQGVVDQPTHSVPHDSYESGRRSEWQGDSYTVRRREGS